MRVAVLGGYNATQSVGAVMRAFKRAGHEVTHIPTMPEFIETDEALQGADLLFTFKIGLERVPQGYIKSLPVKTKIFWSFDDPHWVKYHCTGIEWAREHDAVFTSCKASEETYKAKGCPNAFFMPPAMDLEYYPTWTTDTRIASFICTTLYPPKQFPNNLIDRSKMIDRLTAAFGDDFRLYGYNKPIETKKAWAGPLDWATTLPEVIRGTRLNINNHVVANEYLYFNERFFQIAATRRAQFVDRVSGFADLFSQQDLGFIFYSSLDELVEKLVFYKDKDLELVRLGDTAFHMLNKWTYDEFVKQTMLLVDYGGVPTPSFMRR